MQIRLMTKADAEPIAAVLNHAIKNSIAHFGTTPTSADEVLGDWHAAGEVFPWLVACDDAGAFLGFAKGSAWRTRRAYRWTVETGIYLVDSAHSKGIGTELYRTLFALLEAQGYRILMAGVSLPNPPSERLHESMGMSAAGDFSPAGYKFGQWISVRRYHMMLGDPESAPSPIRSVTSVWEEMHPTPSA
ncbi:MAG: N-acetyltransferase family protein [Phycisphaerales bacterium]